MVRIIKKPAERRLDIVRAARSLFRTQEYEKTTMQDVMDVLNIAKGTIYHYFTSKEALLEAVIVDIVDTNIEHMQNLIENTSGTALEKIQILFTAGDISAENEDILDTLHKPSNSAMHSRLLAVTLKKQALLYEKLIRQGCDEGVFQTNHPLECAEFLLAGVQFLTDEGIYPWTQADILRRADAFPELIEHLLKAPPGSFKFMLKKQKLLVKKMVNAKT
jgi:AcrR family transcriptional regulator